MSGYANTPNPTNEIQRQQEREEVIRKQQIPEPDVRLQIPQAVAESLPEETNCFMIDIIRLTGDEADQFQWALSAADQPGDEALGRCLGGQGVNLIMKRIQNAIIKKGYVTTRVLAKPQDLNNGELELFIVPGRIKSIRFDNFSQRGTNLWTAFPASPGDLLNLRDIEQALENLRRLPTAEADIQIVPGAQPGESDLVVLWKQRQPLRFSLSADDSGSEATGRYQGSATLSVDNPFLLNDLFYASFSNDLGGGDSRDYGTEGYSLYYMIPVGYWTLSFSFGKSEYHQTVAGATTDYIYRGDSETGSAKLSRLLYRDATQKLTLGVEGWTKRSSNYIDDTEVLVQRRRTAGWAADIQHQAFIGQNVLNVSAAYRRGTGAFDTMPAPEEAFNEGTSRFTLITLNAGLQVPFTYSGHQFSYSLGYRGQWNKTPLVPQDRFSIGNRYTVRGFDGEATLSSERGWLIRNDLGWHLPNTRQELYLGLDYGRVSGPSVENLLGHQLAGTVLGLRGSLFGIAYDTFAGMPLDKPDGFETPGMTLGFNLNWSL
ncbi:ShlB/FhaC/HecB family hemolysin secretion/activation protein [Endozoicomonas sp. ALE010]